MKLRWYLLALISITLGPLALGAAFVVWRAHDEERHNIEQALRQRAQALAIAVDREVETCIATLEGLAMSDHLDAGDLPRFYAQARRAKDAHPHWLSVVLMDPTGRQLLNLLRPLGTSLPSMAGIEVFQRTVATGQPAVSELFMSPTAGRWLVAINVPVLRDGRLRYVLSAGVSPDGLAALLGPAQVPAGGIGVIVDRKGVVVAHSRDPDRIGKAAPESKVDSGERTEQAVIRLRTGEGGDAYTAFSGAPRSQLTVGLAVPAEQVDAPLRRSLQRLLAAAVAVFGVSLGLAVAVTYRLTRRTAALGRALDAFGRGEPVPDLPRFWVNEFKGVTRALRDAMTLLQARTGALRQSEAALRVSEGRYRRLIEESAEGIIIHQAGTQRFVNTTAARMLGYDRPSDAIGQSVAGHLAPEYRDAVLARIEARLRGDPVPVTNEIAVLRRDGSRFWVEATATVVEWEDAPATRVSIIDITDRRQREAAEWEAEKLRSVASLANATAHEINNPLTVIAGNFQLLRDELHDRPKAQLYAERVQRAVEHISQMIDHMQHITRLEPLKELDTGGLPTLDLRRSSGPSESGDPGTAGPEPRPSTPS